MCLLLYSILLCFIVFFFDKVKVVNKGIFNLWEYKLRQKFTMRVHSNVICVLHV
jgi:hypothetical protein